MRKFIITAMAMAAIVTAAVGAAWALNPPPGAAAAIVSAPPPAAPYGFLRQIGESVTYEGVNYIVWGYLTSRHRADGKIYQYYLLADRYGRNSRYAWVGWVDYETNTATGNKTTLGGGDPGTDPPPEGGCPDPPGDPC